MTVNTTRIQGFVVLPNDTVPSLSKVIFTMTGFDTDADDDATVVGVPVEADIAEDGSIDIDLWPNPEGVRSTFYRVTFSIYNGNKPHLVDGGLIEVPVSGGPYDLNDLLPIAPPSGASVDEYIAQLAAAVAATEAAAATADNEKFRFASRPELVTWWASNAVTTGGVVLSDADVSYVVIPVGHALYGADPIADLPGLLPFGDVWTINHFGAVGYSSVTAAEAGDASDVAIGQAITAAGEYFATTGETAFPAQAQQAPLYALPGVYRISDTIAPSRVRPWSSIQAAAAGSVVFMWDYQGVDNRPMLNLGTSGENFRFLDIITYVSSAATLPSYWIEMDRFIDYGFAIDGSVFWEAEEGMIKFDFPVNVFLRNFKFEGSNDTMLKVVDTGNTFNRVISIRDWSMHVRGPTNPWGSGTLAMSSLVDMTYGGSGSAQITVKMENQRIELDYDGVASNFDFVTVSGNTNQQPGVIVHISDCGVQMNNWNGSDPTATVSLLHADTSTDLASVVYVENMRAQKMDNLVRGTIDDLALWPDSSIIDNQQGTFYFATHDKSRLALQGMRLRSIAQNEGVIDGLRITDLLLGDGDTLSAIAVSSNAIDITDYGSPLIPVSATSATDLTTISGGRNGQGIYLKQSGSNQVTLKASGNINLGNPGLSLPLDQNGVVFLLYDPNSDKWNVSSRIGRPISFQLPSYTVATAPTVTTAQVIYVSDGDAGSPCLAAGSGGQWKRISLGAAISAT